ncbi:MAG: hypothetical protein FLDDKLPJ_00745 [Phycisphaerae bacterium]|nr:hypothetical protein [Phycisphaerae bacterium]
MNRGSNQPWVSGRPERRGAFTLAELVVAVAILALMMLLAGQVFTITVKSTGQATALTNVNQRLRLLEETLREDLRYVTPENSILFVQGRPVRAYWTKDGMEGDAPPDGGLGDPTDGYPHFPDPEREDASGNLVAPRADLLAFFTSRLGTSAVYNGAASHSQFVVYGHANAGKYSKDVNAPNGYALAWDDTLDQFPRLDDPDELVASRAAADWMLSRRSLLMLPSSSAPVGADNQPDPRWRPGPSLVDEVPETSGDYPILKGLADIVYNYDYTAQVLRDAVPPPYSRSMMGNPPPGAMFYDDQLFPWMNTPYQGRSIGDAALPSALAEAGGLSAYFLPRCASFKVEWTFEDAGGVLKSGDHVVWFDTWMRDSSDDAQKVSLFRTLEQEEEYYRARRDANRANAFRELHDSLWSSCDDGTSIARPRFDPGYFGGDVAYAGIGWFPRTLPLDCNGNVLGAATPDPFFPTALRITVDVVDDLNRLDKPIRHVMVIPVGR